MKSKSHSEQQNVYQLYIGYVTASFNIQQYIQYIGSVTASFHIQEGMQYIGYVTASFNIQEGIRHQSESGNKVYMATLDTQEAFDSLLIYGLFVKPISISNVLRETVAYSDQCSL